jgi:hypothetical protein
MASHEYSTIAAISRRLRSARDSASFLCRAMLPAKTEMARNTASRSASALDRMEKLKKGATAKKSRQAVETTEQNTAGPKPRKRAVNMTAASNKEKRWRCKTGENVQRLRAIHTVSAAAVYCTSAECFFRANQLIRIVPVPDILYLLNRGLPGFKQKWTNLESELTVCGNFSSR